MILFAPEFQRCCLSSQGSPGVASPYPPSPYLCFIMGLFVSYDHSNSERFIMLTKQLGKCFEPLQKLRSRLDRRVT